MGGLPEIKSVLLIVTPLEAAVIAKLREFDYGEMTIKKREGLPYQVIKGGCEILTRRMGMNIKDAIVIPPELDISGKSSGEVLSKLREGEYGKQGEGS